MQCKCWWVGVAFVPTSFPHLGYEVEGAWTKGRGWRQLGNQKPRASLLTQVQRGRGAQPLQLVPRTPRLPRQPRVARSATGAVGVTGATAAMGAMGATGAAGATDAAYAADAAGTLGEKWERNCDISK